MKNENYYIKRFKKQEEEINKLTITKMKELQNIYKDSSKELEKELAYFIQKYSYANELNRAELKRMLNTKEVAKFKYTIKEYVQEIERLGKNTREGTKLKKELDILAGRTRIARIEELKAIIDSKINTANMILSLETKNHLSEVVSNSYNNTLQIIKRNTIGSLDTKLLEQIVGQKWSGKNYSDRIWNNRSKLAKKIMSNVVSGLAQGKDFISISEQLQKDMNSGYFEARRVIHTETTFALERAKAQAYKDMKIQKYRFIAVMDKDTSEICQKLNGQEFEIKNSKIGINCPAMHPFCRSITVPVIKKSIEKFDKNSIIKVENKKIESTMETEDYINYMELINNNPNKEIRELYYKYSNEISNIKRSIGGGAYNPAFNTINYSYSKEKDISNGANKYSILAHEYGHYFDKREFYKNLTYKEVDTLNSYFDFGKRKIFKDTPSSSDEFLGALLKDKNNFIKLKLTREIKEDLLSSSGSGGVQDALDGMFGTFDACILPWGHGDAYYNRKYTKMIKGLKLEKDLKDIYKNLGFNVKNQAQVKELCRRYETASEAWANICSAVTCGGKELEYIKKYLPNMYETFLKIIKKIK